MIIIIDGFILKRRVERKTHELHLALHSLDILKSGLNALLLELLFRKPAELLLHHELCRKTLAVPTLGEENIKTVHPLKAFRLLQ